MEELRDPYTAGRAKFNQYCAMIPDQVGLQFSDWPWMQARLAEWAHANLHHNKVFAGLFVGEEAAELLEAALLYVTHVGKIQRAITKHEQKVRGMGDVETFRKAIAKELGDAQITLLQVATAARLDLEAVTKERLAQVTKRNWKDDPETGGERA